jgi:WD40 repeat protein
MSTALRPWLLAGCGVLALLPCGPSFAPAQVAPAGPLPAGAVVRLGTARPRHSREVQAVAFSPDGRTLGADCRGQIICLWELATGQARGQLGPNVFRTSAVAFSPDGRRLASSRDDGSGIVWDVTGLHGTRLERLRPAELEGLWRALAGEAAVAAHRAIWRLSASPAEAVPFERSRRWNEPARRLPDRRWWRWPGGPLRPA